MLTIVDSHDPAPLEFVEIERFRLEDDGSIRGSGVRLTEEGTDLFFGPYTQGTPFADLWIDDPPTPIVEILQA